MNDTTTDFCVVGGGPAGLTLALLLARSGVRVTVMERSRSLDRPYRGEILQPGGQALLSRLGVLAGARERGSHEHGRFLLLEKHRVLMNGDYRRLPGPFNCLLSLPQPHLLAELLDRCAAYPGFEYLKGVRCTALIEEGGRIRGAVGAGPGGDQAVRAHCVVGADGRFSKVRRLAGIEQHRMDVFNQDVLWFKLSAAAGLPGDVQIFRAGGNPVLAYGSPPSAVQLGWTLPHGGYRELAERGLGHIKAELGAAAPHYAEQIDAEIADFGDLSLLDVFSGVARSWVRPGLLLLGDSAHTHGPIGAQGINLAVQDAVAAHPALLASLRAGDAGDGFLARVAADRRRDIGRILRIQALQGKAMLATGRVAGTVRPRVAGVLSHTPAYRVLLRQIAFGNRSIQVRADLFAGAGREQAVAADGGAAD